MSAFQTAFEAIDYTLALQKQTAEVEHLTLRIGIHLGEVVELIKLEDPLYY